MSETTGKKPDGIFIRKEGPYAIYYRMYNSTFAAYDEQLNEVVSADSEKRLIERIKENEKEKWKPTEVIDKYEKTVVTITSRTVDEKNYFWMTWRGKDGQPKRKKAWIEDRCNQEFFEKTDANMSIIEKVQQLEAEKEKIDDEINRVLGKLECLYKPPLR